MNRSDSARAAVLVLTAAFFVAPASGHAKALEKGDSGSRVAKLQRALGVSDDGTFGPATVRAVKRYQRRHHLKADGIVGTRTWRRVVNVRKAHTSSKRSKQSTVSRGRPVKLVQRKLGIPVDGVYGPATKAAVQEFQRKNLMTPDGVVGPATWNVLGYEGKRPVLKRGHLQRPSHRNGVAVKVAAAIRAGNRIATKPYRYGGGHGSFRDTGYDCSGSVSYVLHAIGALKSPLPSTGLMEWGEPGPGRWITVYANGGHAFMIIDGRRYDTSGRWDTGSRWQRDRRPTAGYVARHPAGL